MCNMASSNLRKGKYRWTVGLCTVVVLCSLTAHLTADTVGAPPELAGRLTRGLVTAAERMTRCDLLGEIALPAVTATVNFALLAFLIKGFNPTPLNWVLPPPVRPPIVIC